MSRMEDPPCLIQSASEEVRAILKTAALDEPAPVRLQKVEARLLSLSSQATWIHSAVLKMGVGVLLAALAFGATAFLPDDAGPPQPLVPSPKTVVPERIPTQRPALELRPKSKAENETELLDRAYQAMRHSKWADALDLVRMHERRFPGGQLIQEREVIAVEALAKQGRWEDARIRGALFLSKYPGSGHRLRVETLLTKGQP